MTDDRTAVICRMTVQRYDGVPIFICTLPPGHQGSIHENGAARAWRVGNRWLIDKPSIGTAP